MIPASVRRRPGYAGRWASTGNLEEQEIVELCALGSCLFALTLIRVLPKMTKESHE
jgi:hypothetical protein